MSFPWKSGPALLLLTINLVFLSGCASIISAVQPPQHRSEVRPDSNSYGTNNLNHTQKLLVDAAHWSIGRKNLSHNGKTFAMDCSGVVSALYWKADIDLQAAYPRYTGNGVTRIYRYLDDERLLYRPDEPAPGDIIFWDNSYDKNKNGLADDELTHVGMVVSVDEEGNVTYVHHDYISGIIFASMYPPDPKDRSRNSGMRISSLGPTPDGKSTAGELYRKAGRGWELEPAG